LVRYCMVRRKEAFDVEEIEGIMAKFGFQVL
jgi:hypothetical protein